MINEQRWKTNYIGLLEAGNCFYENVNCVCQADTKDGGGRAEWGQGNQGATDRASTAPPAQIIDASRRAMFNTLPLL